MAQLSYDALLLHEHLHGVGRIAELAGSCYDPVIAALLMAEDPAEVTEAVSPWEEVLASEPGGPTPLDDVQLDAACEAAADFADLKSPWLLGHSRGVAELAEAAAWRTGLDADRVAVLRRGALLHDPGRVVVPTGIWDRPGPLREGEWELVRLNAYHGERVLARSPGLARLGVIAGAHHERLDGSGYHRGSAGSQLPAEARLLAAADCYQAMTHARPHRDQLDPEQAAVGLRAQVRDGRLDGGAVQAVLAVAGHTGQAGHRVFPAGLSEREAQVLGLLAFGHSNRQIASRLGITPKTVGHHVGHLYAKIGVSTRAAAALFALEHGLLPGQRPGVWGVRPMPAGQRGAYLPWITWKGNHHDRDDPF